MNRYEVQLRISSEAYLDYYRGTILHVIAPMRKWPGRFSFPRHCFKDLLPPKEFMAALRGDLRREQQVASVFSGKPMRGC
jgi:hypothetical protein